eukprot:g1642.t1
MADEEEISEDDALAAIERVELRLSLLRDETKVSNILHKLLPRLLKLLSTNQAQTRAKVLDVITHLLRRVRDAPNIKLPKYELRKLINEKEHAFTRNFACVFLKLVVPSRLEGKEAEVFFPFLIHGISTLAPASQKILLGLAVSLLPHVVNGLRILKTRTARKERFAVMFQEPADVTIFLNFLLDLLLFDSQSKHSSEMRILSALGGNDHSLKSEEVDHFKLMTSEFLCSHPAIFSEAAICPHLVVCAAGKDSNRASKAQARLKQWEPHMRMFPSIVARSLLQLICGIEGRRRPCQDCVREMALKFIVRSSNLSETNSSFIEAQEEREVESIIATLTKNHSQEILKIIADTVFSASLDQMRSIGLQLLRGVVADGEKESARAIATIFLPPIMNLLEQNGSDSDEVIESRDIFVESLLMAVATIARRFPGLFSGNGDFAICLLQTLASSPAQRLLSTTACASAVCRCYRGDVSDLNVRLKLLPLLLNYGGSSHPFLRLAAIQWSVEMFKVATAPEDILSEDLLSKERYARAEVCCLCIELVSDDRSDVVIAATEGLQSIRGLTNISELALSDFNFGRCTLPAFSDLICSLSVRIVEDKILQPGQRKMRTHSIACAFQCLQDCLVASAFAHQKQSNTNHDVNIVNDCLVKLSKETLIKNYFSSNSDALQDLNCCILAALETASRDVTEAQVAAADILSRLTGTIPGFARQYLSKLSLLRTFLSKEDILIRVHSAKIIADVAKACLSLTSIYDQLRELRVDLEDRKEEGKTHGVLLLFSRLICVASEIVPSSVCNRNEAKTLEFSASFLVTLLQEESDTPIIMKAVVTSLILVLRRCPNVLDDKQLDEMSKTLLTICSEKGAQKRGSLTGKAAIAAAYVATIRPNLYLHTLTVLLSMNEAELLRDAVATALTKLFEKERMSVDSFEESVDMLLALPCNGKSGRSLSAWILALLSLESERASTKNAIGMMGIKLRCKIQKVLIDLLASKRRDTQTDAAMALQINFRNASMLGDGALLTEMLTQAFQSSSNEIVIFGADRKLEPVYRELKRLACRIKRPQLIFAFLGAAATGSVLEIRMTEYKHFGIYDEMLTVFSSNIRKTLIPRLYLLKYHPNKRVSNSMRKIWRAMLDYTNGPAQLSCGDALKSSKVASINRVAEMKLCNQHLQAILTEVLSSLSSSSHRERAAACAALANLLGNFDSKNFSAQMRKLWSGIFRAADDLNEDVRPSANLALRSLTKLSTRLLKHKELSIASHAADIILPFLAKKLTESGDRGVKNLAVTILCDIILAAGPLVRPHIVALVPGLLEAQGVLENQLLNYIQQHTFSGTIKNLSASEMEKIRIDISDSTPQFKALQLCIKHVTSDGFLELRPKLCEALRGNGAGLVSIVSASRFVGSLTKVLPATVIAQHASKIMRTLISAINRCSINVAEAQSNLMGQLIKIAKNSTVRKSVRQVLKLEGYDEMTLLRSEIPGWQLTAVILKSFFLHARERMPTYFARILPIAFIYRHRTVAVVDRDERKAAERAISTFENVWSSSVPSTATGIKLYFDGIILKMKETLTSVDRMKRKQGACALLEIMSTLKKETGSKLNDYVQDLLPRLLWCSRGQVWDGKELLVNALVKLTQSCPVKVSFAMQVQNDIDSYDFKENNTGYDSYDEDDEDDDDGDEDGYVEANEMKEKSIKKLPIDKEIVKAKNVQNCDESIDSVGILMIIRLLRAQCDKSATFFKFRRCCLQAIGELLQISSAVSFFAWNEMYLWLKPLCLGTSKDSPPLLRCTALNCLSQAWPHFLKNPEIKEEAVIALQLTNIDDVLEVCCDGASELTSSKWSVRAAALRSLTTIVVKCKCVLGLSRIEKCIRICLGAFDERYVKLRIAGAKAMVELVTKLRSCKFNSEETLIKDLRNVIIKLEKDSSPGVKVHAEKLNICLQSVPWRRKGMVKGREKSFQ